MVCAYMSSGQGFQINHFLNVLAYVSAIYKDGSRQYTCHNNLKNDITLSSNFMTLDSSVYSDIHQCTFYIH